MGVSLVPRKRYRVTKFSKLTSNILPSSAPEAARRFWTERGAVRELNRLSTIAASAGLPYGYRVQKIYGK